MLDPDNTMGQNSSEDSNDDDLKRLQKSGPVTTQLEKDLFEGVFVNPSTKQASQNGLGRAN